MPRYMITFCHVDGVWDGLSPEVQQRHGEWLAEFARALREEKGSDMVFLNPMTVKCLTQDASGQKTVRDGQAAGEAESLGGYFVLEAKDMEEALAWADKARFMEGSNEVREIMDFNPEGS